MKKCIPACLCLFTVIQLFGQRCKVDEKYGSGYVFEVYDNNGVIVPDLFRVTLGGTEGSGITDTLGNFIIPGEYNDEIIISNGKAITKSRDRKICEVWDLKTKTKVKLPAVDAGSEIGDNGLIAIKAANKKWGYCDSKGKIVIPAKFDYAEVFVQNKAVAQAGENYGIINEKGTWVIPPKKGVYYYWVTPSLLVLQQEDKEENIFYGFMDDNGKVLLPPIKYMGFEYRQGFLEMKIEKNKGAIYNYGGKKLTEDNCYVPDGDFKTKAVDGFLRVMDSKGLAFVMDTAGNRYLSNKYTYIYQHKHDVTKKATGLYTVRTSEPQEEKAETYTIVKLDGAIVFGGLINDVINYDENIFFTGVESKGDFLYTMRKADGTILAKDVCSNVTEFYRHFAFVKKEELYGALNMQTGEWVLPLEYKGISSISGCSITLKNKNDEYIQFDQNLKPVK